jgi:mannose-6-phosphate isomerase-like protein (cupin superfamily)
MLPSMRYLLAVLVLTPALAAVAQQAPVSNTYTPPKESTILPTTDVDWDSLVPRDTAVGQMRQVFDNPTTTLDKLELHVTTLNPGKESHPPHHHPWEEMLLIKDGEFEVNINGKQQHAGPGCLVFFASNDPHNARNAGSTPGTYYVINFVSDLAHDSNAKPAAQQNLPGKLASGVYDPASMKPTVTKAGQSLRLFNSPTLTFEMLETHITTLNPGQISGPDTIDHND